MRQGCLPGGTGWPSVPAKAGTRVFARRIFAFARSRKGWIFALGILTLSALAATSRPAAADFRLCNNTTSRVGVSIGYKAAKGWTTEGWWNLPSNTCETLLRGNLVARYYYVYAIDYDRGGEWMGHAYMCTREKEFTIRGINNCLARGYDRTGFFEVDTGQQRAWTVQLTESSKQPRTQPTPIANPLGATSPAAGTALPAMVVPPAPAAGTAAHGTAK